ncbi:hypothetical protein jhhlp_000577 [Lomentospora prolificans]|uniref:Chromosome segregation in meiosis protein n=1 Tax=Lomentospora prolificans TaxID=41688 RepID=A0A2N3NIW5_9PEZI|nr:hypothetical protein jhhlp_000577 [Lomentospora prolificans]
MASEVISDPPRVSDDLDDYDIELEDFFEDDQSAPLPHGKGLQEEREGLGLEDAVSVVKRARIPRVKLDEQRLLSEDGIPRLRKRARKLRLKGKGHEFADAARILSLYQLWLDDLFPKAKFSDALSMVEKAGHKTILLKTRREWIAREMRTQPTDAEAKIEDPTMRASDNSGRALPNRAAHSVVEGTAVGVGDDVHTGIRHKENRVASDSNQTLPEEDVVLESLMRETLDSAMDQDHLQLKVDQEDERFADDEAAMAEMGGLW